MQSSRSTPANAIAEVSIEGSTNEVSTNTSIDASIETSVDTAMDIEQTLHQIIQLSQTQQFSTAIALCQQILSRHPTCAAGWHALGMVAFQQGKLNVALEKIQQAIALSPTVAEFHDHAGVIYCQLGQIEAGIQAYRIALNLNPDAVDTRYNLALAWQNLGQWQTATTTYLQVLAQQPDYIWAHQQLGHLSQQQQQPQAAIAHYRQALQLNPTFAPAQQALAILLELLDQSVPPTDIAVTDIPPTDIAVTATDIASPTEPVVLVQIQPHQSSAPSAVRLPDLNSSITCTVTCTVDDGFQDWLSQAAGAIAISTYQAGKLAFVGWDGTEISLLLRQFDKPMGIAVQGQRLALATRHEILLFANSPTLAQGYLEHQPGRYDALYLPRATYFTGDLNVHDLAWGDEGLWMVNSRFSCLSQLSADFSFMPRWQPPFISELVPEDRCHLNGLAMVAGQPRYVTALGATDEVGGWRADKAKGGIVMDVATNEILLRGLSMPHAPVWHQDALWVLNSGAGELWQVDPESGQTAVVCTLPGFLRGLCMVGNYAIVGLSQIRERHIFGELPVQTRYPQLLCGLALIDLRSGAQVGLLEFPTGCEELYDIQFMTDCDRPNILNCDRRVHQQAVTAPEIAYWLRPSAVRKPQTAIE
jgi:uncharacterized protein (TIGR03032 family)